MLIKFGYPVQTEAYLETFLFPLKNDWQVTCSKQGKSDVKLSHSM